jgi:alcohol dehydrogenase class IV
MRAVRPHCVTKFAQVWNLVPGAETTLSDEDKSHALVEYFAALVRRLNLPDNLETLGVPREDIAALSDAALNVKRLMNNAPYQVNHDEVQAIYRTLFPQH